MPAAALLAPAARSRQGPHAQRQVDVVGEERVGGVDRDVVGNGDGNGGWRRSGFVGGSAGGHRGERRDAEGEGDGEQDADRQRR